MLCVMAILVTQLGDFAFAAADLSDELAAASAKDTHTLSVAAADVFAAIDRGNEYFASIGGEYDEEDQDRDQDSSVTPTTDSTDETRTGTAGNIGSGNSDVSDDELLKDIDEDSVASVVKELIQEQNKVKSADEKLTFFDEDMAEAVNGLKIAYDSINVLHEIKTSMRHAFLVALVDDYVDGCQAIVAVDPVENELLVAVINGDPEDFHDFHLQIVDENGTPIKLTEASIQEFLASRSSLNEDELAAKADDKDLTVEVLKIETETVRTPVEEEEEDEESSESSKDEEISQSESSKEEESSSSSEDQSSSSSEEQSSSSVDASTESSQEASSTPDTSADSASTDAAADQGDNSASIVSPMSTGTGLSGMLTFTNTSSSGGLSRMSVQPMSTDGAAAADADSGASADVDADTGADADAANDDDVNNDASSDAETGDNGASSEAETSKPATSEPDDDERTPPARTEYTEETVLTGMVDVLVISSEESKEGDVSLDGFVIPGSTLTMFAGSLGGSITPFGTSNPGDLKMNKTAIESATLGVHTVTLDVTPENGSSSETSGAADVVLVFDVSGSMSGAWTGLKDAADVMVEALNLSENGNHVGIVIYSGKDNSGLPYRDHKVIQDFSSNANAVKSIYFGSSIITIRSEKDVLRPSLDWVLPNNTNAHAGFVGAKNLFDNSPNKRTDVQNIIVYMTDGGADSYYDTDGISTSQGATGNWSVLNNCETTTLTEALNLKENEKYKADIYTVGYGGDTVAIRKIMNPGSKRVDEPGIDATIPYKYQKEFHPAGNAAKLKEIFEKLAQTINSTMPYSNVTITDPMSVVNGKAIAVLQPRGGRTTVTARDIMVTLGGVLLTSPTMSNGDMTATYNYTATQNTTPSAARSIVVNVTPDASTGAHTITLKHEGALDEKKLAINYDVKIDTTHPSFQPGEQYPANGKTTIDYDYDGQSGQKEFGVPNVEWKKSNEALSLTKETHTNGLDVNEATFEFVLKNTSMGKSWNGTVTGNGTVSWGGLPSIGELPAGDYVLTETAHTDYDLTNVTGASGGIFTAASGGNPAKYEFKVVMGGGGGLGGSDLLVTATNKAKTGVATFTATKAAPAGLLDAGANAATFTLTRGVTQIATGIATAAGNITWTPALGKLDVGKYVVTETTPGNNLNYGSVSSTVPGAQVNDATKSVTFEIHGNTASASVAFTNVAKTADGGLTIKKALPANNFLINPTDFFDFQIYLASDPTTPIDLANIAVSGTNALKVNNTIRITGTNQAVIDGLTYGQAYIVKEILPADSNYELVSFASTTGTGTGSATDYKFTLNSGNPKVTTTATNKNRTIEASNFITVKKVGPTLASGQPNPPFTMKFTPDSAHSSFATVSADTTMNAAAVSVFGLAYGVTYTVSELTPVNTDYELDNISITSFTPSTTLTSQAIVVTNKLKTNTNITAPSLVKNIRTNGMTTNAFTFTLKHTPTGKTWAGTLTNAADGDHTISWSPALPTSGFDYGEYTIAESGAGMSNFDLASIASTAGFVTKDSMAANTYKFTINKDTTNADMQLRAVNTPKIATGKKLEVQKLLASGTDPALLLDTPSEFVLRRGGAIIGTAKASTTGALTWILTPSTIDLNNLEYGVYEIEETEPGTNLEFDGITRTSGFGTDANRKVNFTVNDLLVANMPSPYVVQYTNKAATTAILTIEKVINGVLVNPTDKFDFQIQDSSSNPVVIDGTNVILTANPNVTLSTDKKTITITGQNAAEIKGLTLGTVYHVVELLPPTSNYSFVAFSASANSASVVKIIGNGATNDIKFVKPGTATITATNSNRKTSGSDASIEKIGPPDSRNSDFQIVLTPSTTAQPAQSPITVPVKAGQTVNVPNLIYGLEYTVSEINLPTGYDSAYAVTINGSSVTGNKFTLSTTNTTAAIKVTNQYKTTAAGTTLALAKSTATNGVAVGELEFKLTHDQSGQIWTGKLLATADGNGTILWQPSNANSLSTLPHGPYTLEETTGSANFDLAGIASQTAGFGSFAAGKFKFTIGDATTATNLKLTATNQIKAGTKTIKVSKTVETNGFTNPYPNTEFDFRLLNWNGAPVVTTGTDASGMFRLKAGESKDFTLGHGAYYIQEIALGATSDYTFTSWVGDGTNVTAPPSATGAAHKIVLDTSIGATQNATATNTLRTMGANGALSLAKATTTNGLSVPVAGFQFAISGNGKTYYGRVEDSASTLLASGDVVWYSDAAYTVKIGDKLTGLPFGVYTVTETPVANFTLTDIKLGTASIKNGAVYSITINSQNYNSASNLKASNTPKTADANSQLIVQNIAYGGNRVNETFTFTLRDQIGNVYTGTVTAVASHVNVGGSGTGGTIVWNTPNGKLPPLTYGQYTLVSNQSVNFDLQAITSAAALGTDDVANRKYSFTIDSTNQATLPVITFSHGIISDGSFSLNKVIEGVSKVLPYDTTFDFELIPIENGVENPANAIPLQITTNTTGTGSTVQGSIPRGTYILREDALLYGTPTVNLEYQLVRFESGGATVAANALELDFTSAAHAFTATAYNKEPRASIEVRTSYPSGTTFIGGRNYFKYSITGPYGYTLSFSASPNGDNCRYVIEDLLPGTYTVTPSQSGLLFDPVDTPVTNVAPTAVKTIFPFYYGIIGPSGGGTPGGNGTPPGGGGGTPGGGTPGGGTPGGGGGGESTPPPSGGGTPGGGGGGGGSYTITDNNVPTTTITDNTTPLVENPLDETGLYLTPEEARERNPETGGFPMEALVLGGALLITGGAMYLRRKKKEDVATGNDCPPENLN